MTHSPQRLARQLIAVLKERVLKLSAELEKTSSQIIRAGTKMTLTDLAVEAKNNPMSFMLGELFRMPFKAIVLHRKKMDSEYGR
ncbi:hypothetical protein [Pedobacter sp. GR22-6]|uniref:hypothetical protein n=1 Tax=Pedobacter sp. GR22-6 TaxID=3127957 RepID=UPI00307EECCB